MKNGSANSNHQPVTTPVHGTVRGALTVAVALKRNKKKQRLTKTKKQSSIATTCGRTILG